MLKQVQSRRLICKLLPAVPISRPWLLLWKLMPLLLGRGPVDLVHSLTVFLEARPT